MAEKRGQRRTKKRLAVKFGESDLTASGFTVDLSLSGAFITSPQLVRLDARLHLQFLLDAKRHLFLEAEVRRHKVVPHELHTVERGGFGVRFLSPTQIVKELQGNARPLEVRYATLESLWEANQRELRSGAVFLPTSTVLARGASVTVDLVLEFAQCSFEVEATVLQVSDNTAQGGGKGMALAFTEPKKVAALLAPFVDPAGG